MIDTVSNEYLRCDIVKHLRYMGEMKEVKELITYAEHVRSPWNRKHMQGHFTASGLVMDESGERVLLIYHNALKRYLQPGGHIESEDKSVWAAAKREVEEETGMNVKESALCGKTPILLDVHTIPENKNKGEAEHRHFDFLFLFELEDSKASVRLQREEVSDFQWVGIDYPFAEGAVRRAVESLRAHRSA